MLKKIIPLGVVLIMIFLLMGFMSYDDSKLKLGIYTTEDGLSSLTLYGDNEYIFNRHIATNYRPTGNYLIVDNKLVLYVEGNEEFVFDIKNGQLIFISGYLAGLSLTCGKVFTLLE